MDLGAYFARIAWTGPRAAAGDALAGIYAHHVRAIPFENLDVLLGRPPELELAALEAKLVHARRGGYCYEHATLFAQVLRELGVEPRTHSARVIIVTPRHLAPRTHMFLTLGELVLDPGFGGQAPLAPVPLDGTPAGDHRIVRVDGGIALEMTGADGGWQRLWWSTLEHDQPIDFEMANHFTATHASSPFVQRLMARTFTRDGKVGVMNRDVTIVRAGETRTHRLADRAELRALIAEHFGFDLPTVAGLRVPSIPEWQ
ncbi:MAG TPA: arylamine N-acetyltransferase [Kofleriaceae bacterium]|nr:arylamine N-acetyltransferase [Kofleriaceae bacterium]